MPTTNPPVGAGAAANVPGPWTVPDPPPKKQKGPEGAGAWITELVVAKAATAAATWAAKKDMLIKNARSGMPTPGAKAGSANWAPAATVAWALSVPNDAEPWQMLEHYADWCLGGSVGGVTGTLWSSETLSDVYGWTLHLLSHALLAGEKQPASNGAAKSAVPALRRLLETHLWLLRRLTVTVPKGIQVEAQGDARILYQQLVWTAGERSPPSRHNGALLSNWLGWIEGRAGSDKEVTKSASAWTSWPFRLCRVAPPTLTAQNHGARLRSVLEVTTQGQDVSVRLLETVNGNTAPTAAASYVGGKLYSLSVGQRDRRVRTFATQRGESTISGAPPDGQPASIPAPSYQNGTSWHLGPAGFAQGRA